MESGEVGGILVLPEILFALLCPLLIVQPFLREQFVVDVVEVHPDDEYFSDILLPADGVVAEEGEGPVLDEVTSDHRVHNQVQDHQLLDVLDEGLLRDFCRRALVVVQDQLLS